MSLLTDSGAVRESLRGKRTVPLSTRALDKALAEALGRSPVSGANTGVRMMCLLEVRPSPIFCPGPRGAPPPAADGDSRRLIFF